MRIVFGTSLYGSRWQTDDTYVATKFAHILYLPLVPLSSFRLPHKPEVGDTSFRGQPIPMDLGSAFLGYFKTWGFILGVALGFTAFWDGAWPASGVIMFLSAALVFASVFSWMRIGKSPKDRSRITPSLIIPTVVASAFAVFLWFGGVETFYRQASFNAVGGVPQTCGECFSLPLHQQTDANARLCASLCSGR